MPPLKLDFDWSETEEEIRITVKLGPSVPRRNLDVLVTDALVKVNAHPYLLQLDLHGDVDEEHGTATITTNLVSFVLPKRVSGLWGHLLSAADAPSRSDRRAASIEEKAARDETRRTAAKAAHAKLKKDKEEEVWQAESVRRGTIDRRKEAELDEEREKLRRWQERTDAAAAGRAELLGDGGGSESDADDSDSDADDDAKEVRRARLDKPAFYRRGAAGDGDGAAARPASSALLSSEDRAALPAPQATPSGGVTICELEDGEAEDLWLQVERKEAERLAAAAAEAEAEARRAREAAERARPAVVKVPPTRELPAPRQTNVVKINLTRLEQPHLPAREQREKEIKMWKKQQQDQGLLLDSQDITERQPVFLKDKGDDFLKRGNAAAAINAYTRALELEAASPNPGGSLLQQQLLANRAAARLKAGDFTGAAEDCSAALDALERRGLGEGDRPRAARDGGEAAEAAELRRSRFRLLVRRGTALAELGNTAAAAADFEAALRLSPGDERLKADLDELRSCAAPLNPEGVRKRGDARFKAGDLPGAVAAYDSALRMPACPPRERVAALANRASARMAGGDFGGAVDDCTSGLRELVAAAAAGREPRQSGEPAEPEGGCPAAWIELCLEAGGPERAALPRLLARRGAARGHLRLFEEGAGDLLAAAGLLREEGAVDRAESLESDAERLRSLAREEGAAGAGGGASDAPEEHGGEGGGQGSPLGSPGAGGGGGGGEGGGGGGEGAGGDQPEGAADSEGGGSVSAAAAAEP